MSVVTNLILHIGFMEDEDQRIKEVNEYFVKHGAYPLISLDDASLPRGWYGGSKMLECHLYVGAFNLLFLSEFLDHLRTICWEEPDNLQVIVMEQEDDKFRIIEPIPGPVQ